MNDEDDEQLGRLYRAAISQLPGGRPDPALARATAGIRRRNQRRVAGAIAAAAAMVIVLVVVTPPWSERAETTAVPAGGGEPTASATCPALLPGTSNAAADYVESFRWNDQTYITSDNLTARREPGKLGRPVTKVTCSISELTADNGNLVANGPWPNGTATFLPTGTQVFAIQGVQTRCELGVRDSTNDKNDNAVKLFVAVREPDWEPVC